jgi:hypothetical protein
MKKEELTEIIKNIILEVKNDTSKEDMISRLNEIINKLGVLAKSCKDEKIKEKILSAQKELRSARSSIK